MKKKITWSLLTVALVATSVTTASASAATADSIVIESKAQSTKTLVKTKNGHSVVVVVPSELSQKISDAMIDNIVKQSSENAFRITLNGITPATTNVQMTEKTPEVNQVSPDAWYDISYYTLTQVGSPRNDAAWGIPFIICTTAEGQSFTFTSKFTHTDTYSISGTYNDKVLGSLTSQLSTSRSYEISAGVTFAAPPEDPNYRVTRYYKASIVNDVYPFTWTKYGNPSGDIYETGSGNYMAPDYYANWSEDVKF